MGVSNIREELHQFINEADEETVNRIYELIKSDHEQVTLLSKEQRLDLNDRIERHKNGDSSLFSWQDVRQQIENRNK